jgi:hypothetical protein
MITISSAAGVRLAKAKVAMDAAATTTMGDDEFYHLVAEYEDAADAVADELIAQRHHEREGD